MTCRCGFVAVEQMLQRVFVYSPSVKSTQLSSVSGKGTEIPIAFRIPYVLTMSPGVTCCASSFRLLVTLSARKDKWMYLYAICTHKIPEMSLSPCKQLNYLSTNSTILNNISATEEFCCTACNHARHTGNYKRDG